MTAIKTILTVPDPFYLLKQLTSSIEGSKSGIQKETLREIEILKETIREGEKYKDRDKERDRNRDRDKDRERDHMLFFYISLLLSLSY